MGYVSESSWETAFSGDGKDTDLLEHVLEGCSSKTSLNISGPFRSMKEEDETLGEKTNQKFWKDLPLTFFQAFWEVEFLIIFCNVAVLIVLQLMQVKVPVVGAETFPVFWRAPGSSVLEWRR